MGVIDAPQWLVQAYQRSLVSVGASAQPQAMQDAAARLITMWSTPDRHFHTIRHLIDLLARVDELADETHQPDVLRLAAWYHGCVFSLSDEDVYRRNGGEDEVASAAYAASDLLSLGVPAAIVDRVCALTLNLKRHNLPDGDIDAQALSDADLGTLAADPQQYKAYRLAVREEYAHIPQRDYLTARLEIISRLLARPALFSSPLGERWERPARENLSAELNRVTCELAALEAQEHSETAAQAESQEGSTAAQPTPPAEAVTGTHAGTQQTSQPDAPTFPCDEDDAAAQQPAPGPALIETVPGHDPAGESPQDGAHGGASAAPQAGTQAGTYGAATAEMPGGSQPAAHEGAPSDTQGTAQVSVQDPSQGSAQGAAEAAAPERAAKPESKAIDTPSMESCIDDLDEWLSAPRTRPVMSARLAAVTAATSSPAAHPGTAPAAPAAVQTTAPATGHTAAPAAQAPAAAPLVQAPAADASTEQSGSAAPHAHDAAPTSMAETSAAPGPDAPATPPAALTQAWDSTPSTGSQPQGAPGPAQPTGTEPAAAASAAHGDAAGILPPASPNAANGGAYPLPTSADSSRPTVMNASAASTGHAAADVLGTPDASGAEQAPAAGIAPAEIPVAQVAQGGVTEAPVALAAAVQNAAPPPPAEPPLDRQAMVERERAKLAEKMRQKAAEAKILREARTGEFAPITAPILDTPAEDSAAQ